MAQTQRQKHLTDFVGFSLQQKKRVDQTIASYKELDLQQRERVIDQKSLIADLSDHSQEQVENLTVREQKDSNIRTDVQSILATNIEKRDLLVAEMQHHLIELTDIEIASSGFIAHQVATDHTTKFDDAAKIISFEKKGIAEVPIATYLTKWKDSSQLRFIMK